jgi:ectoine hydroxylase-related dioxygenase (phytanoyl-CoA dioxygenase family)
MCGVWIALEDVDERNGPLVYLPGSHKLPELYLTNFGLGVHGGSNIEYAKKLR